MGGGVHNSNICTREDGGGVGGYSELQREGRENRWSKETEANTKESGTARRGVFSGGKGVQRRGGVLR